MKFKRQVPNLFRFTTSHTHELSDELYLTKYENVIRHFYKLEYNNRHKGYASLDGTTAYSQLRSQVAKNHFRKNGDLLVSSIGIGSYQGAPDLSDDTKLFGSIIDSVLSGGVNHIDTAINYRYMKSERVIGAVLNYLLENTQISREQLFIASKNGYIPADGDRGLTEEKFIEGIDKDEIAGSCHCMAPEFLEKQLEKTLSHLGVETLDLYYLHNTAESQLPLIGYDKFYSRLAKAFEFCEKKVQEGKIRQYGLATWVCFRAKPEEDKLYVPLQKIVEIARKVGGEKHNFKYVQVPINIMMPETFAQKWQIYNNEPHCFLDVAKQLNINVVSSSPLLSGQLIQLPLPSEVFKCQNLGAKHLQFLRSLPYDAIKTILIGQKANRHTKMNLEVIKHDPLTADEFWKFLRPKQRTGTPDDELEVQ